MSPLTYNETENKRFISFRKFSLTVEENAVGTMGVFLLRSIHTERKRKRTWKYSSMFVLFFDLFRFCSCFRLVWIDP